MYDSRNNNSSVGGGGSGPGDSTQQKQRQQEQQQQHQNGTTVYFTVLRDPIDRFISATCQDLRDGSNQVPIHKCFGGFKKQVRRDQSATSTTTMNDHDVVDDDDLQLQDTIRCLIKYINGGRFTHHQRHQYCQLRDVMNGLDVAINVIPFDRLNDLYRELGAATNEKKVRDRTDARYVTGSHHNRKGRQQQQVQLVANHDGSRSSSVSSTKSLYTDRVASFCSHGMSLLSHSSSGWTSLREDICEAYKYDVQVLSSVGMDIPLCHQKKGVE
jgi:Sulfotransferase family